MTMLIFSVSKRLNDPPSRVWPGGHASGGTRTHESLRRQSILSRSPLTNSGTDADRMLLVFWFLCRRAVCVSPQTICLYPEDLNPRVDLESSSLPARVKMLVDGRHDSTLERFYKVFLFLWVWKKGWRVKQVSRQTWIFTRVKAARSFARQPVFPPSLFPNATKFFVDFCWQNTPDSIAESALSLSFIIFVHFLRSLLSWEKGLTINQRKQ